MIAIAVLLIAGGALLGDSGESSSGDAGAALPSPEHVDRIEREVERIRGQKFKERVVPKVVPPEVAREEALRDIDKTYPEKNRRADEELLKLTGLIPPDTDIREVLEAVTGEQVVGYYDPRREIMRVVSGNGADSPALVDITLAHELTHALEDQVFELEEQEGGTDDEATALTALHEGTASYVHTEFTSCCVDPGALLSGALGALGGTGATQELPPYIERSLLFSYTAGERFVRHLYDAADGWRLVDTALESQPPVSSEQIIHPEKYAPFEPPLEIELRAGAVLGDGWRRASRGTLGEADTREILRLGDEGKSVVAAAGWGGGEYELWRRDGEPPEGCGPPCRPHDALIFAWRWDSPRDAREFVPVLRQYVAKGLKGRPAGDDAWALDGGAVALSTGPAQTTLAWAPDAELARRLADRAAVSSR